MGKHRFSRVRHRVLPAILLACASIAPAAAQDEAGSAPSSQARIGSFGLGIGTNGIAVDYAYGLNRWLDLRAGLNFGSLDRELEEDGIDYDAEISFSGGKLLLDIKPFAGGFRISTGIYTAPPELELDASGLDDYEIGGATYRGDLQIDSSIDLGSAAPYLGIGWGGTANATGFGVSFDIGVMFTDSPQVGLAVDGRACDATLTGACDPDGVGGFDVNGSDPRAVIFQNEREAERQNLEQEAEDFDLWPVIQLALHYRF